MGEFQFCTLLWAGVITSSCHLCHAVSPSKVQSGEMEVTSDTAWWIRVLTV